MKKILKFWGTRGSCPVSGPEYSHFGGNTPSLEIRYDHCLAIIDAGTGIRPLGATLKNEKKIDLFLSHFHWDHIMGFPFFEPIYQKGVQIAIWAPHANGRAARDLFDQLLAGEFFPIHLGEIQAEIEFRTIEERKPVQLGPLEFDFHQINHPGHTLCFKIKTPKQMIGYVTDNEIDGKKQDRLIDFLQGAELLVHEAQYFSEEYEKKKGWGHSSLQKAIDFVNEVRPEKWLVTHHDPNHTDADLRALEKIARSRDLLCPVEWIGDGHVIDLQ